VGKNIILLSDGTGNSAASAQKTNVWRLYQALDCSEMPASGQARQIAHYDDGVGTGSFKPLALIGLALGIGVWGNVRDLYTFLCRNYEDGDRIYLFGFSRGAFTVRLLAGLIGRCGLVTWETEQELLERVGAAYYAYRRDFLYRAALRRPMPLMRAIVRRPEYEEIHTTPRSSCGSRNAGRTSPLSARGTRSMPTGCPSMNGRSASIATSGR
jgi:uncharacterized protein (DUF2235 family)